MRYFKRCITNLSRLFAEDSTEKSLLCRKLGFALGSNLTYKDISRVNLCADTDDTVFVKVCESVLADIGNISCDFLCAELGVSCFDFKFFYMNRCINIVTNKLFVDKNGVLVVITLPGHKADKSVLAE